VGLSLLLMWPDIFKNLSKIKSIMFKKPTKETKEPFQPKKEFYN
jgi:hypothetical protein